MLTLQTRLAAVLALLLASSTVAAQVPSAPGEWPQWRGPHRNGISTDEGLLKEWPQDGPPVLWQVDTVGVGYSSLAVKDGRVFTQGDLDGVEHVIALDAETGKVLWAVQPEPVRRQLEERLAVEVKQLDKNGDGQIDEAEALQRLGWRFNDYDFGDVEESAPPAERAAERATRLVRLLDKDGDGQLEFTEAGEHLREYFARIDSGDDGGDAKQLAETRCRELVKQLDRDGNGLVSREEARRSPLDRPFGQADERDPQTNKGDGQLSAEEIETYLARHESGKDGRVALDELAAYYAQHHPSGDGVLEVEELRGYYGGYRNGMGDGPRGTPTVDGQRVYAEGGNGDLTCLDAATGKTIWYVNLSRDLGGGRPGSGCSESPLIEGDLVIVTPGGKQGTVAALNKLTGQVVWRSTDTTQNAHYSSPLAADVGGVRQIVQFARESVFGVTADSGKLLWKYAAANNGTANCCTPIVFKDHVFASSAYGTGGGLARILVEGDTQQAEEVYFDKRMANHHGGIVRVGDYMYGFGSGGLICMNFLTGEVAWRARSVGKGSLTVADGMLYLLSEGHKVALAELTPEEYRECGRFEIPSHARPSWAHPVVAGGRFYIRDQGSLTAYDVRDRQLTAR